MADSNQLEPPEEFSYVERFPDGEQVFSHLPEPFERIQEEALVFLDTNVLLLPYSVDKQSLDDIVATLKRLKEKGQLRVPAHAAREFAVHRVEQIRKLKDKVKPPALPSADFLLPVLSEKDEVKRYAALHEKLGEKREWKELEGIAQKIHETIAGWHWRDPVSLQYQALFDHGVVADYDVSSTEKREELAEDYARRLAHGMGPGTADRSKNNGNRLGDLIIWKTIIRTAHQEGRHAVLVSSDSKRDWIDGQLYTRMDLVLEFARATGGLTFRVIEPDLFFQSWGAKDKTVKDLRAAKAWSFEPARLALPGQRHLGMKPASHIMREQAVVRFLMDVVLVDRVELMAQTDQGIWDFGCRTGGLATGVIVKSHSTGKDLAHLIRNAALRMRLGLRNEHNEMQKWFLFVILREPTDLEQADVATVMRRFDRQLRVPGTLFIGTVERGRFVPTEQWALEL